MSDPFLRLAECGTFKITDISEFFSMTTGAATGMTDKLEEQGLVKRQIRKKLFLLPLPWLELLRQSFMGMPRQ